MIGKSTLILKGIRPYIKDVSGFMCIRLMDKNDVKAFSLMPVERVIKTVDTYEKSYPNIFLIKENNVWKRNEDVFIKEGNKYLSNIKGKKLMVLDEIGGIELLIEPFKRKIYEVLNSGIPCIGVIKSLNNKTLMKKSVKLSEEYEKNYEELFNFISLNGNIFSADEAMKDAELVVKSFTSGSIRT